MRTECGKTSTPDGKGDKESLGREVCETVVSGG